MPVDPPARLVLIVTGSTLRAEELDRPLAYYLKQKLEERGALRRADGADDVTTNALVIADFRWMNDDPLQPLPTISVGGPGVNALAHQWFEAMPFSLAVDEQYYIQMDPDLEQSRASLWGMDNATTQIAVSVFVDRFLDRFLDKAEATAPPDDEAGINDPDSDPDADDDDEADD